MANEMESKWRSDNWKTGQRVKVVTPQGLMGGILIGRNNLNEDPKLPPKYQYYVQMDGDENPPRLAMETSLLEE